MYCKASTVVTLTTLLQYRQLYGCCYTQDGQRHSNRRQITKQHQAAAAAAKKGDTLKGNKKFHAAAVRGKTRRIKYTTFGAQAYSDHGINSSGTSKSESKMARWGGGLQTKDNHEFCADG